MKQEIHETSKGHLGPSLEEHTGNTGEPAISE